MYFYIQFSRTSSQRFSAANTDHAANLLHSEIYVDLLQEFYDRYELPALHHDGDGFRQGDASDEELEELLAQLNLENNEEKDFFPIFHFLDKQFMSVEEEAYDNILAKYEDDTFQERKSIFDLEIEGSSFYIYFAEESVFETKLKNVSIENEEELVYEAEQFLLDCQRYGDAPYNGIQFNFIECEDSRVICHLDNKALAEAIFNDKILGTVEHRGDEKITFTQFAEDEWTGYDNKEEYATLKGEFWYIGIEETSTADYAEENEMTEEEVIEQEESDNNRFQRLEAVLYINDVRTDIEVPMF